MNCLWGEVEERREILEVMHLKRLPSAMGGFVKVE